MNTKDWKRFWSKVKIGNVTECWPWTAALSHNGYGRFRTPVTHKRAHRVALEYSGIDSSGQVVRHTCDNPACCNPMHLKVGTHQDNADDMCAKGRQTRGEGQHLAKLTKQDVVAIRASSDTRAELARLYNVTVTTIAAVINRKTWKHV